jgi:hypothetical protein
MAMMATTTSNSMRVKAIREERRDGKGFMASIRTTDAIQRPENESGNGKRITRNAGRVIVAPTRAMADPGEASRLAIAAGRDLIPEATFCEWWPH